MDIFLKTSDFLGEICLIDATLKCLAPVREVSQTSYW